jgi:hypothetical protein
MKRNDNLALKLFCALVFSLVITVTGCKTPVYTSFAPFDARLEPIPDSVARYIIFLNTGGRALHNYSFSAYLWDDETLNRFRREKPIKRYMGSGVSLLPGQSIRFHPLGFGIEDPIRQPMTRVELTGHCDEGDFRQSWRNTPSGQLQSIVSNPQK